MAEIFRVFVSRIGPLVTAWDTMYNLFTIKDTRNTLTFLCVMTYAIIYNETVVCLLPFTPLLAMLFIFHNYFYQVKFKRPPHAYFHSMRLLQTIMQATGDTFEVQHYIVENFFYWKSKEKTLFTLNLCFIAFIGMLPLLVIPLRYLMVAGLWGVTSLSSPFFMAVFKSLAQIGLEYGIVFERLAPAYTEAILWKIEMVYLPTIQAILRWIPIINRYVPGTKQRKDSVERRHGRPSQNAEYSLNLPQDSRGPVSAGTSQLSSAEAASGRRATYEVQQHQQ